jgi:hypothetical protein
MQEVEIPLLHNEDKATHLSIINLCALDMTSEAFQLIVWLFAIYESPSVVLSICCMMSIYAILCTYTIQQKLSNVENDSDPVDRCHLFTMITGSITSLSCLACVLNKVPFGTVSPPYIVFLAVCQLTFTFEKIRFIPIPTLTYEFIALYKRQNIIMCFFTLTLLLGSCMDVYRSPQEPFLPVLLILYGCSQMTIAIK